jgi:hypothetical protein
MVNTKLVVTATVIRTATELHKLCARPRHAHILSYVTYNIVSVAVTSGIQSPRNKRKDVPHHPRLHPMRRLPFPQVEFTHQLYSVDLTRTPLLYHYSEDCA